MSLPLKTLATKEPPRRRVCVTITSACAQCREGPSGKAERGGEGTGQQGSVQKGHERGREGQRGHRTQGHSSRASPAGAMRGSSYPRLSGGGTTHPMLERRPPLPKAQQEGQGRNRHCLHCRPVGSFLFDIWLRVLWGDRLAGRQGGRVAYRKDQLRLHKLIHVMEARHCQ